MSIKFQLFPAMFFIAGTVYSQSQDKFTDSLYFQQKAEELEAVIVIGSSSHSETNAVQEYSDGANLDKILEANDKLQLVKRGGYAFEPVINGKRGGQTAITINGMRIFNACTDNMDPVTSYVSTNNLEGAEVGCGHSASKYGSSLNASLNMNSDQAQFSDSLKIRGIANLGAGSTALEYNSGLKLNLGNNKWAILATGTKRKANPYRSGNNEVIDFTQYQKENLSGNFRYKAGKKAILEANYIYDKAFDIGYAALPMDVSLAEGNIAQLSGHFYNLTPWITKSTISAYANRITHIMDDTERPPETVPIHMDMPGSSNTIGAYGNFEIQISDKDLLEVRLDYYRNYQFAEMLMYPKGEAPMYMVTWPGIQRNALGIYVNHQHKFKNQLNLSTSIRVENSHTSISDPTGIKQLEIFNINGYTSHTHTPMALQTELSKPLNKKIELRFGTGYSSRMPTGTEMYGYYLFNATDGYDYIGDPSVEMESAVNGSFAVNYKSKKNQLTFSSNYQYITNYIYGEIDSNTSRMTIGANGVKKFTNLPYAQLVSLSSVYSRKWSKKWITNIQGSYTWGEKHNKVPLPQLSPFSFRTNLEYRLSRWKFLGEIEGATEQELIDTEFVEFSSPSWAIVNLRAKRQMKLKPNLNMNFQFGVENLLNKTYRRHLDWGKILRPGINIYGSVSIEF